jgi:hypothetical protein
MNIDLYKTLLSNYTYLIDNNTKNNANNKYIYYKNKLIEKWERTHKERTHKERTHKERTHKERTHKERTHKERTHKKREKDDISAICIMDTDTDEDNKAYVAFIKEFTYVPVLLHLAADNPRITDIITRFQQLPDNEIPDKEETNELRDWVDANMDTIGNMSQDDINQIIQNTKLVKLNTADFYKREYALSGKRKPSNNCLITMDPIRRDEYYVGFLDKGMPYKVAAIIQYYKRMKNENEKLEKKGITAEWKTPLRNIMSDEDREKLEDLINWYENPKKCTRSKRTRNNRSKSPISKTRSPTPSPSKKRKTRRR